MKGTAEGSATGVKLLVDASANGKLQTRGSDAQFNKDTIIKVPVSVGSVVTVVSYPGYHNYTVAGTDADADSVTTAVATEAGYVEIVATSTAYLYSISVTNIKTTDYVAVSATWDFQNNYASGAVNIQQTTGTVVIDDGVIALLVDASANGKLQTRGSDAQFNKDTIIKVPVSVGSVVTVVSHPGYHNYTVAGTDADADSVTTAVATEAGYVEIVATATAYLYSISVTDVNVTEWR